MAFDVLRDLVLPAIERHGDRLAVVATGQEWTYKELRDSAIQLSDSIIESGIRPGDPVAIVMENGAEYMIADLAILIVGATKVPVNMMLSDDEVKYILRDSGAKMVLTSRTRLSAVMDTFTKPSRPNILTTGSERWNVIVGPDRSDSETTAAKPRELPQIRPDDTALIMYTGGTTGKPKGVVHTQRSCTNNLLSHVIESEVTAQDRLLLTSPLPHSAGFLALTSLLQGAVVYIEEKLDIDVVLDRIEKDRVSYLFMVPTMIYRMLDEMEARSMFDSSSLRTILYGASPITEERLKQGLILLGPVFVQLYGQTEAPNFLTRLRREDHSDVQNPQRLRSCGQSVLLARVRTIRKDGTDCASGEVGEVAGTAPYVMEGYLGKPEATASAMHDGWLFTGDLGYLDDDGYLYLVDRKKDMIITGGFNVYASEVEQALATLDGVNEVAAVGVPHHDWGEAVIAFVVPDSPAITEGQILRAARTVLSGYKRPKEVVFIDELPVTAVGKIDKKRLRQQVRQTIADS